MKLDDFEKIVIKLANSGLVRYWKHYNFPSEPPQLAVLVPDCNQQLVLELEALGLRVLHNRNEGCYFTAIRTDE